MKVKMNAQIKNLDGAAFTEPNSDRKVLLRDVCSNAILFEKPDAQLTGPEKYERYKLAEKISKAATADLTAEEITLLKDVVADLYNASIVGPVWDMLEGR